MRSIVETEILIWYYVFPKPLLLQGLYGKEYNVDGVSLCLDDVDSFITALSELRK